MHKKKVINSPRACARGLDVDGINTCKYKPLRPRARARESLLCTWREACEAADYVLEHFGDRDHDRRMTAPETENTFQTIRRNRYCHPVRDWAIYDIQKAENLSWESAKRLYNRHLARLHEIFGVPVAG